MVECPNCGHIFRARREAGQGSRVNKSRPMTKDDETMFAMVKEAIKLTPYGVTNRQIVAFIFSQNPRPVRASGKSWNAHYVQAQTSRLNGRGVLLARKMDKGNSLIFTLPEEKKEAPHLNGPAEVSSFWKS